MTLEVDRRVRVVAVTIRAGYGRYERRRLLKWLNATGTVVSFDPRWTLPWRVRLDNGEYVAFAKESLEVLAP